MPFLLKTEPEKYSFDDLLRDGETVWDGISNNQALLSLRTMKKGRKTRPLSLQYRESRRGHRHRRLGGRR